MEELAVEKVLDCREVVPMDVADNGEGKWADVKEVPMEAEVKDEEPEVERDKEKENLEELEEGESEDEEEVFVNVTHASLMKCNDSSSRQGLCENGDAITINGKQLANASVVGKGDANSTQVLLGKLIESKDGNTTIEEPTTD